MRPKPLSLKAPAERVLKDIRRATRRHFSAEDKIRIVLDGLRGDDSIAELCRREGIAQSLYYVWSKEFLEAGKRRNWVIEVVKRNELHTFVILPKRWIVERTIAWLNRCRRLAKDWENLNRKGLAFLRLASIRLMLRKLCNPT